MRSALCVRARVCMCVRVRACVRACACLSARLSVCMQQDKSPLHVATERGHTNIVDLLIDKYKTSVAARTKDGNTLMHIASSFGHPETALAFLKRGVPLLMPNKVKSKETITVIRSVHTRRPPSPSSKEAFLC